jgi:hypothetical protein
MDFMPKRIAFRILCFLLCGMSTVYAEISRLPVLHVVGDVQAISPADSMVQARLAAIGLDPILIDDDVATTADTASVSLILIEESCASSKAEGKFKSVSIPVINMEPFAWDTDCYIDTTREGTFGRTPGPENFTLEIRNADAIESGWKAGDLVTFYAGFNTARNKLGWAVPAGDGFTFARLPGTSQAVIFGYESGASMANGFKAPARRAGFSLMVDVADSLTDSGWQLFYAVLNWCLEDARPAPTLRAAFVTKTTFWNQPLGDLILWQRLMNEGFDLQNILQDGFFSGDYSLTNLIVISESVDYGLTPDLYYFGIPILNCEQTAYHMTTPWVTSSLEDTKSLTADHFTISNQSHFITDGLTGDIRIASRPTFWGGVIDPGGDATILAKFTDSDGEPVALFTYRKLARLLEGKQMQARFVGFPFQVNAPKWATEPVWQLWDRSLEWVLEPDSGVSAVENTESVSQFALFSAYPNPFNPTTLISYSLPSTSEVHLAVFDIQGRLVETLIAGRQEAGSHSILFDGKRLASGVYFCHIRAGSFHQTQRMVLLK